MKREEIGHAANRRFYGKRELFLEGLSPRDAFLATRGVTKHPAMIEVGGSCSEEFSFCYIGVGSARVVCCGASPFEALREEASFLYEGGPLPLAGTKVGALSYDAAAEGGGGSPSLYLLEHEAAVTYDLREGRLLLSALADGEELVEKLLDKVEALLSLERAICEKEERCKALSSPTVDVGDADFCARVERAKEYLRAGDAFQIVLSRTFHVEMEGSPFSLYSSLREKSSSPYKFYLQKGLETVVGASPERLIRVEGRVVENMPIAGTRPLSCGDAALLEEELLNDQKEHAEHMMLVDLARNDIGRVAVPGSVEVVELKRLYRYSHIMHLVSRVRGVLAEGFTAVDALQASFPAGTLSGAPKIRAMEIIRELEPSPRGLYGGAILLIDQGGNLDSFIAIRMAIVAGNVASIRAGAGIVAASDPMKEAEETYHKARALLFAIEGAEEVVA